MNKELQYLFEKFESKIKEEDKMNPDKDDPNGKYNFYIPKIRDYLMVYLDNQLATTTYNDRVRLYFQNVFNREHLIEATMFYVENCKTRGISENDSVVFVGFGRCMKSLCRVTTSLQQIRYFRHSDTQKTDWKRSSLPVRHTL